MNTVSLNPMKTPSKPKPSEMPSNLRQMVELRHSAEQRGHYEPLGRLLYLKTAHGIIRWPADQYGEAQGPDVACAMMPLPGDVRRDLPNPVQGEFADWNTLLLLGPWLPLPPIRVNSSTPCPRCRNVCPNCHGEGQKQCEQVGCGGLGHVEVPGQLLCTAPGCVVETGKINPNGCEKCRNSGMIPRCDPCEMCHGTKVMTCPVCKGSKKISTGKIGGSTDYKAGDCRACHGTGWKAAFEPQNVEKFVNAVLDPLKFPDKKKFPPVRWLALGPIHEFAIEDSSSRMQRSFEVSSDSMGDFLMLLIPAGHKRQAMPAKAYLVGGVVRERVTAQGVA